MASSADSPRRVAVVDCGDGAWAIALAMRRPAWVVCGFDPSPRSVRTARRRVAQAGVSDRVTIEVARSSSFPGTGYDLVVVRTAPDSALDERVLRHVRRALAHGGSIRLIPRSSTRDDLAAHRPDSTSG